MVIMKKAIVTGANGFVGGAVTRELLNNGYKVIALDLEGHNDNIPEDAGVLFYPFSLDNASELKERLEERDIDIFYHFAWAGSAGAARADTNLQLKNAQWTIECLKLAKELGCRRFVNAGSIMELETIKAVFNLGNKPGLGYIYGSGKLVAHTMCKSVAADIGIELVWAMITNAYGVGERSPRMVNTTIQKCIRGESPQFTAGTQNYDFVYIDDVARAFRLIGENGKPFHEYIIGSSHAKPLKEFLLEMKAAIAPDLDFIFGDIPFTGVNQPLEDFDCSNTEADTGFKAEIDFGEGCRRTCDWWRQIIKEEQEQ
jgi:nucleoside-diphosphate-sugar epimerase